MRILCHLFTWPSTTSSIQATMHWTYAWSLCGLANVGQAFERQSGRTMNSAHQKNDNFECQLCAASVRLLKHFPFPLAYTATLDAKHCRNQNCPFGRIWLSETERRWLEDKQKQHRALSVALGLFIGLDKPCRCIWSCLKSVPAHRIRGPAWPFENCRYLMRIGLSFWHVSIGGSRS